MFCPKGLRVWLQTQPPSRSQLYQVSAGRLEVLQAHTKSTSCSETSSTGGRFPAQATQTSLSGHPSQESSSPASPRWGPDSAQLSEAAPQRPATPSCSDTNYSPALGTICNGRAAADCFPSAPGAERGTGASGGPSSSKLQKQSFSRKNFLRPGAWGPFCS